MLGWWLGIFRCRCCGFNAFHMDSLGVAERLSDKIATCHGEWFTGMVYGIVLPTKILNYSSLQLIHVHYVMFPVHLSVVQPRVSTFSTIYMILLYHWKLRPRDVESRGGMLERTSAVDQRINHWQHCTTFDDCTHVVKLADWFWLSQAYHRGCASCLHNVVPLLPNELRRVRNRLRSGPCLSASSIAGDDHPVVLFCSRFDVSGRAKLHGFEFE